MHEMTFMIQVLTVALKEFYPSSFVEQVSFAWAKDAEFSYSYYRILLAKAAPYSALSYGISGARFRMQR
jgi:hypothetical protein